MTYVLPLPPLVGSRKRAEALCAEIPDDANTVRVDVRQLVAYTDTFADELVQQITVQRGLTLRMYEHRDDLTKAFRTAIINRATTAGTQHMIEVYR
ncbi:hypothetical protein [Prescottella equi]|uniref:hypothetical protein n=1 Tax=Rhodococcus hoagii TaxID=43767 RepID=UPI001EE9B642|nr:hypothetical protein [Prescottella equi]